MGTLSEAILWTPNSDELLMKFGGGRVGAKWYTRHMPRFEIDVDPCDHITADAIGKPGQRVFYIQAFQDQRTVTVIIEKAQLNSMAIGIEQFLSQLDEQNPDLSEASGDYVEEV